MLKRKLLLATVFIITFTLVIGASYSALAEFPEDDLTAVVAYGPGGSTDIATRYFAETFEDKFGYGMNIENRAGAGGAIAASHVLAQPADGHTLLFASGIGSFISIAPYQNEVDYDREDLRPVGSITADTVVLAVRADDGVAPWESVEELVEYGEENPGELTFGATAGSGTHMFLEYFSNVATNMEAIAVPYDGGAEIVTALAGGHIDFIFQQPPEVMPQVEEGDAKILATLGSERTQDFPDIPTLAEKGYENIVRSQWVTAFVSAETPEDVYQKLHDMFEEVVEDEGYQENIIGVGGLPQFVPGDEMFDLIEEYEGIYSDAYDMLDL